MPHAVSTPHVVAHVLGLDPYAWQLSWQLSPSPLGERGQRYRAVRRAPSTIRCKLAGMGSLRVVLCSVAPTRGQMFTDPPLHGELGAGRRGRARGPQRRPRRARSPLEQRAGRRHAPQRARLGGHRRPPNSARPERFSATRSPRFDLSAGHAVDPRSMITGPGVTGGTRRRARGSPLRLWPTQARRTRCVRCPRDERSRARRGSARSDDRVTRA